MSKNQEKKDQAKKHSLTDLCRLRGLRLTRQRRLIAQVLDRDSKHQDAVGLYEKVRREEPQIAFSTVYRTLRLFEQHQLLEKQSFGQGRGHYERKDRPHHDHLIDIDSGQIVEFHSAEIESLQRYIAKKLGYRLVSHSLELYGKKLKSATKTPPKPATKPPTKSGKKTIGS